MGYGLTSTRGPLYRVLSQTENGFTTDGSGNYTVNFPGKVAFEGTDDVLGTEIGGTYKASVASVSANGVVVLVESPDGADSLAAAATETINEDLTVYARAE